MTATCGPTIICLPIGSDATYGFVFKDEADVPIDLFGSEFFVSIKARYPTLSLEYSTTADPTVLYIEEDIPIRPVDASVYIADQLVLALTPDITRQIPLGALTVWEIERRKDGDQRNWGSGVFRGHGGLNPDV